MPRPRSASEQLTNTEARTAMPTKLRLAVVAADLAPEPPRRGHSELRNRNKSFSTSFPPNSAVRWPAPGSSTKVYGTPKASNLSTNILLWFTGTSGSSVPCTMKNGGASSWTYSRGLASSTAFGCSLRAKPMNMPSGEFAPLCLNVPSPLCWSMRRKFVGPAMSMTHDTVLGTDWNTWAPIRPSRSGGWLWPMMEGCGNDTERSRWLSMPRKRDTYPPEEVPIAMNPSGSIPRSSASPLK
mmetsp:Transcript_118580/g.335437  ORF Transcript_118580/g.335437 Transcript_118580/m.335437 type:complete len:240 (+) Transcript_118580:72-791(+)